ncbi:MAG: hypothetical protein R6U40_10500 [Desulfobacterales bacterium]
MTEAFSTYFLVDDPQNYVDKIEGFLSLPEGWNHGEGIPPDTETVEKALEIAKYAYRNFLSIDSAPGLEGEVQLALYGATSKEEKYLEITFEPSGDFNFTKYQKLNDNWNILEDCDTSSSEDIKVAIDNFTSELCLNISEYSQRNIIIMSWEDTQAWPLKVLETEYQFFEHPAFQI